MPQIDIEREMHDEGTCDPMECPYEHHDESPFHPIGCKCNECLAEEGDFRHREKIDDAGPNQ